VYDAVGNVEVSQWRSVFATGESCVPRVRVTLAEIGRRLVKSARDTIQHDGRTQNAAGYESSTMAGVADDASHVKSRSLARVLQGSYRNNVDSLRRRGS
jgi:hypothetical protein